VPGDRGFTLIEVLVVMVVLAFGILGFLQTTLVAGSIQGRSRAMTAAVFLAQERLERVGALGWDRATAGLERESLPDLLGTDTAHPVERVAARGSKYLLVFSQEGCGVPPRCAVRCFWTEGGRAFARQNAVRLALRRRTDE
jgi:prepilin-type N-terminal cleavage/methylation domain-containing protein